MGRRRARRPSAAVPRPAPGRAPEPRVGVTAVLHFPFTAGGYVHTLLARVGRWCVVERTWVEDGRPHLPHYEIVCLQQRPPRTWPDGRVTPAREAYPELSKWGRAGWSLPTLRHARDMWERLRTEKHPELPTWVSLGLPDDEEGYRAWKDGRLPCRMASAPTRAIPARDP